MTKAIIIIVAVIGAIAGKFIVSKAFTKSIDEQIKIQCEKINKNTPMQIDPVTRLDKATSSPGEIQYHYTLTGIKELSDQQKSALETNTRRQVKVSPDLKPFRDNGIDMSYLYRDESGAEIHRFTVKH